MTVHPGMASPWLACHGHPPWSSTSKLSPYLPAPLSSSTYLCYFTAPFLPWAPSTQSRHQLCLHHCRCSLAIRSKRAGKKKRFYEKLNWKKRKFLVLTYLLVTAFRVGCCIETALG
jgi:hypothetical protein